MFESIVAKTREAMETVLITYFSLLFSFLTSEHPFHRCVSQKFCDPHASGRAEGGRDGGGGDTGDIATNRARLRRVAAAGRPADRRRRDRGWCRALAVTEATNAEQHSSVQGRKLQ